jgi:hypothetical protein
MRKTWGQPVQETRLACGQLAITQQPVGNGPVYTLVFRQFTRGLSTAKSAVSNLLVSQLPAVSTAPTKTTTNCILFLPSNSRSTL